MDPLLLNCARVPILEKGSVPFYSHIALKAGPEAVKRVVKTL